MADILVIDDQEHIRAIIRQLLTTDGHAVDMANDGNAGLKMIKQNHYDLVITDVIMPEKDGLEVIMALKLQFPLVRIIVMTGGSAKVDISNTLKCARLMGADRVFTKPLDFMMLKAAVQELLAVEK